MQGVDSPARRGWRWQHVDTLVPHTVPYLCASSTIRYLHAICCNALFSRLATSYVVITWEADGANARGKRASMS